MANGQQTQTAAPAPTPVSGGFDFGFTPETAQSPSPATRGGFDFGFTPVSKTPAAAVDVNAISNMDMTAFTQKLRQDPNFRQQVSSVRERLPQGMQDTLAQEESVTKPGGESGIAGIMTGAGKAVRSTIEGGIGLVNKLLPQKEKSLRDLITSDSSESGLIPTGIVPVTPTQGVAETTGSILENVAEFVAGDEALKGVLKGVEILNKLPAGVRAVAEAHPRLLKALSNVTKSAVVGGAQGAIKESAPGGEGAAAGLEHGGAGGAIGGAMGEAVPVVTQKLGSVLQKYAPDFTNALLRASKKANFLYGKNPGQAIIDEGINAPRSITLAGQLENLHGQLEAAGESLDNQIKQILSKPAVATQKQDIVPAIQSIVEGAKEHVTEQTGIDTKAYLNELTKLEQNIFTKYNTDGEVIGTIKGARLSPAEISDVKKSIGKGTQWNLDPKDPQYQVKAYVNSVRKQIYGLLADTVEQAAPEVGKLNSRYANVIEAQGLLENRIAQEHGTGGYNAALRKGEWGTALGLIFSGHPHLGLPLIVNRVARSAPGRVLESRVAAATGKAMQSPVVDKIVQGAVPFVGVGVRVLLSDGSTVEVHPEDLEELQNRDPGAKPVSEQNQ